MKPLAWSSLTALILWLLPLGAFIGASQEKTACDGKRAFHMCSMMKGKASESSSKVSLSNTGSVEKTAKSSASGGDDFLAAGSFLRRAPAGKNGEFHFVFFIPRPLQEIPVPPPKSLFIS